MIERPEGRPAKSVSVRRGLSRCRFASTLLLRRLLLRRLLLRLGPMVPDDASGRRAGDGVMARYMPGDAADHRSFHTPLGGRDSASAAENGRGQHQIHQ
jgi:hypothetical protein